MYYYTNALNTLFTQTGSDDGKVASFVNIRLPGDFLKVLSCVVVVVSVVVVAVVVVVSVVVVSVVVVAVVVVVSVVVVVAVVVV